MVCSVDFDDKFEFGAEEVDAVVPNWLLSAEFGAELLVLEITPEDSLREAGGLSEFSG